MGVLTHRPVEELDLASRCGEFLKQEHLVDVVARQTVGRGDQHDIEHVRGHAIAQPLQPGPLQGGTTEAIIAERVVRSDHPILLPRSRLQPLQLLRNAVGLRLALGGHTHVNPGLHSSPPFWEDRPGWPVP